MVPVIKERVQEETNRNNFNKSNKNEYHILPKCSQYSSDLIQSDLYIDCQCQWLKVESMLTGGKVKTKIH